MFYIPKHFPPQEFFPKKLIEQYSTPKGVKDLIWTLMDSRLLWTADQLRIEFGSMVINDYLYGGKNQYRGYRPAIELIDTKKFKETGEIIPLFSSFTSQHCNGRALDGSFKNILAQDVVKYIIKHPTKDIFKFITGIEKEVNWLHVDTRNFIPTTENRFYLF